MYQHLLRFRTNKPRVGDRIWVERRQGELLQPNGELTALYWEDREATFEFYQDKWHKNNSNYETFEFEDLAFCWTDYFGGMYMILVDAEDRVERTKIKLAEIDAVVKNLDNDPLYQILRANGYYSAHKTKS